MGQSTGRSRSPGPDLFHARPSVCRSDCRDLIRVETLDLGIPGTGLGPSRPPARYAPLAWTRSDRRTALVRRDEGEIRCLGKVERRPVILAARVRFRAADQRRCLMKSCCQCHQVQLPAPSVPVAPTANRTQAASLGPNRTAWYSSAFRLVSKAPTTQPLLRSSPGAPR